MVGFEDIRPYVDTEVRPCLRRLLADVEFLKAIERLQFPRLGLVIPGLFRAFIRMRLRREFSSVQTVHDFQAVMKSYFSMLMKRTVDQLTYSGLENLPRNKAALFISNHRDIAMDSAFVNWVLHHHGFSTLRIATGDNLLTKPFASDLMRLNKSFIVKRSVQGPREKLKAAKQLSQYIHQSVLQENENIWIAQREGRAKDGIDATNPAIVSMLALSRDRSQDFSAYIRDANIVPVSISYELDPCDQSKAREVFETAQSGAYQKAEHEDVESIARGITGFKGNVHVSFGQPLREEFENNEAVTAELDRQIVKNYVLHPSNAIAYEMLEKSSPKVPVTHAGKDFSEAEWRMHRKRFNKHIADCDPLHRETLLTAYANPVKERLRSTGAS